MPLFESESPEVILERVLGRMETDLQTREGSWAYDQAAPLATEIWRAMMTLDELVEAFYVNERSGPYLDAHARLFALSRREGAAACAGIEFFGRDGTDIPRDTAFFTEDGREYRLQSSLPVTIQGGRAKGVLTAVAVGGRYNTGPGEIVRIMRTIPGLERFEVEAAAGGADPEADAALFARLDEKRKRPPTSGNEAHYREWALSVDGVGEARVVRCWAGPGTVKVVIAGYDHKPVDGAIVTACAAYIETQRTAGASVTVVSAKAVPVDVAARVILTSAASRAAVESAFTALLDGYLTRTAFAGSAAAALLDGRLTPAAAASSTVYAHRVEALLMSVEGVVDYSGLTINGKPENLVLDMDSVPVVGEVSLA